jgi:hypothetical protein
LLYARSGEKFVFGAEIPAKKSKEFFFPDAKNIFSRFVCIVGE